MSGEENYTHGEHHHHHHHSRSKYSYREEKQSNMAVEVAKARKKTIWLRSIFIASMLIMVLIIIVLIINLGGSSEQNVGLGFSAFKSESKEQLITEIDELKTENMSLKYELEKYKNKYGELE